MAPACPTCGVALASGEAFCTDCAALLTRREGDEPRPRPPADELGLASSRPVARAPELDPRPSGVPLGDRRPGRVPPSLGAVKPPLRLWIGLLIVSTVSVLCHALTDAPSPAIDTGATLLMAAVIVAACVPERPRLAPLWSRSGFTAPTWWVTPAVLVAVFAWMTLYFAVLAWVGAGTLGHLDDFGEGGWPVWVAFVLIVPFPGVFEELAFRGVIQERLEDILSARDALIVQAAMFSVLHLMPLVFVSHFGFGLALGWLRRRTGSLVPGMLVHMAWNAWVLTDELWSAAS